MKACLGCAKDCVAGTSFRCKIATIFSIVTLVLLAWQASILALIRRPQENTVELANYFLASPASRPAIGLASARTLDPPEDLGFDGFCPRRFPAGHCRSPPCEDPVNVFLVWRGRDYLPFMYEAGLVSTMKVFGADYRVIIISDSLTQVKSWYPTIWRVGLEDFVKQIIKQVPTLSRPRTWKRFIQRVNSSPHVGAHTADFIRIAVLYLCGGVYSDFDSLWLKQPPADFMSGGFAVGKYKHETLSNGVMGFPQGNGVLLKVLEKILIAYNPNSWESIGGPLLYECYKACEDMDCRLAGFFSHWYMYSIFPRQAERYFYDPTPADNSVLRSIKNGKTLQLHMYGELTKVATGVRPAQGSLYDIVCTSYGYYPSPP